MARDELLSNHLFIARGCDWINNLLIFYTSFLVPPSLFSIPSWEWWLVERVFVFSIPSSNNGLPLYRLSLLFFFFYSPVPSTLQYTRSINQVTWKWGRTRMKELCIQPGTDHIFYDGSSFNWTEDSFYPRSFFFVFFYDYLFCFCCFCFASSLWERQRKKTKHSTLFPVTPPFDVCYTYVYKLGKSQHRRTADSFDMGCTFCFASKTLPSLWQLNPSSFPVGIRWNGSSLRTTGSAAVYKTPE